MGSRPGRCRGRIKTTIYAYKRGTMTLYPYRRPGDRCLLSATRKGYCSHHAPKPKESFVARRVGNGSADLKCYCRNCGLHWMRHSYQGMRCPRKRPSAVEVKEE